MSNRALTLSVTVAVVGVVLGLGGATLAASAGSARAVERPRTLFAGSRRIYAFALGAHQITWISRTHKRGRHPGCQMYVRTLRTGQTVRAPLPSAGCGVKPSRGSAPQRPVLVSGVAAWVMGSSCGNSECFWEIATITGGEAKARVAAAVDVGCPGPYGSCEGGSGRGPSVPHPALAGHGNLLVYSTSSASTDVGNIDRIRRIVGRRTVPFAAPPGLGGEHPGGLDSLAVGSGAVEVDSTVLDAGDGCGCLTYPAWSPDGSQIAYLRRSRYSTVLAVMNADGSARHDLSATTAPDRPAWSPDGKQLAYAPGPGAIAVVNADGSGAHQIGPGANPAWSPDGSKIAFASAGCSSAGGSISVMNPDGTNVQPLASFTSNSTCSFVSGIAWSPDGTRIAFFLNGVLEVMDADGGNPHPVTNSGISYGRYYPSWSPDSSQIVYDSCAGLWVTHADGTGLRQLTHGSTDAQPSWSPDGKTIVFSSDRSNPTGGAPCGGPFGFPELYLVDPDGSNLSPLSFTKPAAWGGQTTFYAASGKRLPTFPGVPTLAGKVAAVGSTGPSGGHRITLFNAKTGAQLTVVEVGGNAAEFEIAGADSHWIVYRLGLTIYALNVASRKTVRLTRTPANPIGLSVSGRQVAWAENKAGHGRIRAVDLPN